MHKGLKWLLAALILAAGRAALAHPAYKDVNGDGDSSGVGDRTVIIAEKMGLSYEDYRAELKRWYNGYRFAQYDATKVYNPVSIALTLVGKKPAFGATWSQTGRASSLMNVITREGLLKLDYDGLTGVDESEFDVSDLRSIGVVGLLYQTGYLTIKDYQDGIYMLGVPDEEVRRDLSWSRSITAASTFSS